VIARRTSVLFPLLLVTFLSALALPAQADDYQITLDEVHLFVDKTLVPVEQDIECWAWCDYTLTLPQGEEEELEAGGEGDVYVKETYTWNWDGGSATSIEGDHHYKVNWSQAGNYTVKVTCNVELRRVGTDELLASDGPKDKSTSVTIVKVEKLRHRPKQHGSYQDSPVPPSFMAVGQNCTFTFQAISNPEDAETWPSGKPAWGGQVSGSGTFKDVTFNTASTTPSDYKTVSAECGNTVTVNVQVVDITQFAIQSRRDVAGAMAESYYAVKAAEHYETGNLFRFRLRLDNWTEPIDLRYEMWDTDGFDDQLVDGAGDEFSYTFQSGTESEGKVFVRFYIDTNGNLDYGSGEPKNETAEFWVQACEEYSIDVQYSNLIGALTKATVQTKFTEAANLLLRKDSANDWRACVKFTVNNFSQFTATGDDTGDHPDPCTYNSRTQCAKHYNEADVTFLDTLTGAGGVCWDNDWHKVLIEWNTTSWLYRAIAHEHGHGVGLQHEGHVPPQLMHEGVLGAGDTELLEADVDNYDGN